MGADRVALWQRLDGSTNFRATQHWDAEGFIAPITSNPASELPWISARIASGKVLRLARLAELAPEAAIDSATLRAVGIRSLLVVPISVFGKNAGALSIASAHREQDWPDALTPGVSLLSEVFAALHGLDTRRAVPDGQQPQAGAGQ